MMFEQSIDFYSKLFFVTSHMVAIIVAGAIIIGSGVAAFTYVAMYLKGLFKRLGL